MQVYMMTWIERKMAAALYAVPPSATIDEALSHFMEVLSSSRSYSGDYTAGLNTENITVIVASRLCDW